jgi:hypothetical protein
MERTTAYKNNPTGSALTLAGWHIFGLAKLRMYREAEAALIGLGDLRAPRHMTDRPEGRETAT